MPLCWPLQAFIPPPEPDTATLEELRRLQEEAADLRSGIFLSEKVAEHGGSAIQPARLAFFQHRDSLPEPSVLFCVVVVVFTTQGRFFSYFLSDRKPHIGH